MNLGSRIEKLEEERVQMAAQATAKRYVVPLQIALICERARRLSLPASNGKDVDIETCFRYAAKHLGVPYEALVAEAERIANEMGTTLEVS